MSLFKPARLGACLLAAAVSTAHAGPGVVGVFVADVGKSSLSSSMKGCGTKKTKAFGHRVTLFDNGTFEQAIDLNGDDIADHITSGLWSEPREGDIEMMYDGSITQGTADGFSWGTIFRSAEASLRSQCSDMSVDLMYSTVRLKSLKLKLNRRQNHGTLKSEMNAYGQGVFSGKGKVKLSIQAKGQYQPGT